jgi:class 3 adenylate cyclase
MSLRYKALIAVVLLIALLTAALAFSSGRYFEADVRARIQRDLEKDAAFLNAQVSSAARTTRTALEGSANSRELVELFTNPEYRILGGNLAAFADEWLADSEADIAIAALDSFLAEEREAAIRAELNEYLSVTAVASANGHTPEQEAALLKDPELQRFITTFYEPLFAAEPDTPLSASAVLPVAGSVYLVVQTGLFESIQERMAVGIGVVLIELSREWLVRSVPVAADDTNPVEKLVYAGGTMAATTLASRQQAEDMLAVARGGNGEQFQFGWEGETYLGMAVTSRLAPEQTVNRPGFVVVKSLDREFAPFTQARNALFVFAGALALVMALIAYFGVYHEIAKLRRLEDATGRIRQGQFETRVRVRGRDEIASLTKAFNDMTAGLKALGLYTHETLARSILDNPEALGAYSNRDEGTILFTDIAGFTGISETMEAEDLTAQLNEYFGALGEVLRDQRGYVDKFIGDSVMAFWGPPFVTDADYALRAVRSALASGPALERLQGRWREAGKAIFEQRVGIATGEVVVGNIGTDNKKNFTVIGDSVNLASRLEGANKLYKTRVLMDKRTAELLGDRVLCREVDQIQVVGRVEPVRVFEPLAESEAATPDQQQECQEYAKALKAYRQGEFKQAQELLKGQTSGPANWLRHRCQTLEAAKPQDWQPITKATDK